MLRKINIKLLIVIWLVVIFILSTLSGSSFNKIPTFKIPHLDKIIHFIMYFILQFIVVAEYYKNSANKYKPAKFFTLSILFSITYGGIMEILQEYIFTSRTGSLADFLANSIGAIIGSFALLLLYNYTPLLNKIIKK